jgi:hypothetical protein
MTTLKQEYLVKSFFLFLLLALDAVVNAMMDHVDATGQVILFAAYALFACPSLQPAGSFVIP